MSHKVFIADDSLTIQKVIKITLANQPYEITDCSSEIELFEKLEKISPKIIFLDFNLSEKLTGYDLALKIKKLSPKTKILFLLGTFDTLDEQLFIKSGASDKIVKPFDSNKFISICKHLIKEFQEENPSTKDENSVALPKDEDLDFPDQISSKNSEDEWTMSSHSSDLQKINISTSSSIDSVESINPLQKEISDWGMSFPGIINSKNLSSDVPELPPVIPELTKNLSSDKDDIKLPEATDLDYPVLDNLQSEVLSSVESTSKEKLPKPQLVSIDNFNSGFEPLEIEGNYVEDKTDISKIEAQIKDEVEEDLWQADEFENLKTDHSFKAEDTTHKNQIIENQSFDTLKPEIEKMVRMYVQEYLDEMFKQKVEKISWEIIPDLAENLIRQELTKISSKLINE